MATDRLKPVVLIILDGWGVASPSKSNAITLAKTPTYNSLVKNYPAMSLQASGESVGLSWGEIGNSEVGHLNIGSGKLVYQNLPKIDKEITTGTFFENKILLEAINKAKQNKKSIHLIGLFTSGGVHASINHFYALLEMCQKEKFKNVYVHAILDGRDMLFNSGIDLIKKAQEKFKTTKIGKLATISGRFYAMDRDNHWERIELAYKAMVTGESTDKFDDPIAAVQASYDKKVYDEEFVPTVITENGQPVATIGEGDSVVFFNFRSDRARQLTKAFVLPGLEKFNRPYLNNLYFVTMTEFEKDLPVEVAFPPDLILEPLAKVISDANLKQLHIAETEKYAHVTFFFNGGREEAYPGEDRVLIPSPRVSAYDQKPEMSAKAITKKMIELVMKDEYDFIVVNYANSDMVAHTGNLKASIKACEIVDDCLKQLIEVILGKNGIAFVTADHGNAEELINLQSGNMDKEHSTYPVPFIIVGRQWEGKTAGLPEGPNSDLSLIQPSGLLSDVAPTILKIMNLEKAQDMTGESLI